MPALDIGESCLLECCQPASYCLLLWQKEGKSSLEPHVQGKEPTHPGGLPSCDVITLKGPTFQHRALVNSNLPVGHAH